MDTTGRLRRRRDLGDLHGRSVAFSSRATASAQLSQTMSHSPSVMGPFSLISGRCAAHRGGPGTRSSSSRPTTARTSSPRLAHSASSPKAVRPPSFAGVGLRSSGRSCHVCPASFVDFGFGPELVQVFDRFGSRRRRRPPRARDFARRRPRLGLAVMPGPPLSIPVLHDVQ